MRTDANDQLLEDVLTDFLLLGAVKLRSTWRIYALTLGEWTLDYLAYDPSCEPSDSPDFRNGLYCVDENNAEEFCTAVKEFEVLFDTVRLWVEEHGVELLMLADFDDRRFVHGYSEPVEPKSDYIPAGWTGIVDDPLNYVSEEVRRLFLSPTTRSI